MSLPKGSRAGMAATVKKDKKILFKHDPMYLLVNSLICRRLIKDLEGRQKKFVEDNSNKHRWVLWINVFLAALVYYGLSDVPIEEMSTIVSSLMAPAFITGGAWFAISFGGVPVKLLDRAVDITFWTFSAFTVSLSTMAVAVYFVTNIYLASVFVLIIVTVIISSILYDNVDGLKVGLDEALLKGNLANIEYLLNKGHIDFVPRDIDSIKERHGTSKIEE